MKMQLTDIEKNNKDFDMIFKGKSIMYSLLKNSHYNWEFWCREDFIYNQALG